MDHLPPVSSCMCPSINHKKSTVGDIWVTLVLNVIVLIFIAWTVSKHGHNIHNVKLWNFSSWDKAWQLIHKQRQRWAVNIHDYNVLELYTSSHMTQGRSKAWSFKQMIASPTAPVYHTSTLEFPALRTPPSTLSRNKTKTRKDRNPGVHSAFIPIKGSPPLAWHLEVFTSQGNVPLVMFKRGEE